MRDSIFVIVGSRREEEMKIVKNVKTETEMPSIKMFQKRSRLSAKKNKGFPRILISELGSLFEVKNTYTK